MTLAVSLLARPAPAQSPASQTHAAPLQDESMATKRAKAAHRQRRIIFNNDGNDVVHFPGALEPTDANILRLRTTPLLNSHVDSISYCTNRGIGLVLHRSRVNQVLTAETREQAGAYAAKRNVIADLERRNTDALEIMTRFARKHGKEVLWSMRMNDIHDAQNSAMLSRFKRENPHLLFGTPQKPPPYRGYGDAWGGQKGTVWGGYSGVDYGQPEVRELVFRTIEEVCANYDIDGVELDFFRSAVLFKSHAWGGAVSAAETQGLTSLLGRIRSMADDIGARRGRPILIAVHVPDSVGYCESIGIDLRAWLRAGLVDIFMPGGDFLLSPWDHMVALGHKHGVPVYPCVTRAPTSANPGYGARAAPECYRGRALRAWGADADGISMFNMFDPSLKIFQELGDPKVLQLHSRTYYGSEMPTWHLRVYHPAGLDFRLLPLLSPEHPHEFQASQKLTTTIEFPEDPQSLLTSKPLVALHLKVTPDGEAATPLKASLNGHPLVHSESQKGWQMFELPLESLKKGENTVTLDGAPHQVLSDIRIVTNPSTKPAAKATR